MLKSFCEEEVKLKAYMNLFALCYEIFSNLFSEPALTHLMQTIR